MSDEARPDDVPVLLDDIEGVVAALHQARLDEAAAKDRRTALEDAIKSRMGDGTVGTVGGREVVTWREHTTTRVDVAALRRDNPEVAEKYEKTSITRRFNVK